MSAPIDIQSSAKPRRPRRTSTVQPAPAAQLTAEQLRMVQIFATMDDECQEQALRICAAWAEIFPRRHAPALRLVVGGTR